LGSGSQRVGVYRKIAGAEGMHQEAVDYLVAVRVDDETEVFVFHTADAREGFIAEVQARWPEAEWAMSEALATEGGLLH
jgi:hypothetical protein